LTYQVLEKGPWLFRVADDGSHAWGIYAGIVRFYLLPQPGRLHADWSRRKTMKGYPGFVPDEHFWPYLQEINKLMLDRRKRIPFSPGRRDFANRRKVSMEFSNGRVDFFIHPMGEDCWVHIYSGERVEAVLLFTRGIMGEVERDLSKSSGHTSENMETYVRLSADQLMHWQASFAHS